MPTESGNNVFYSFYSLEIFSAIKWFLTYLSVLRIICCPGPSDIFNDGEDI